MKKVLSLLAAVLLLVFPALCMAQETVTYVDPAERYSFDYPADWKLLSKETADGIMDLAADMGDEQLAGLVQTAKEQLETVDMVLLMNSTMDCNINMLCQPVGVELTGDLLLAAAPGFAAGIQSQLAGAELVEEATLIDIPAGQAMLMQLAYSLSGQNLVCTCAYVSKGTDLYVMTQTCHVNAGEQNAQVLSNMLETLRFN